MVWNEMTNRLGHGPPPRCIAVGGTVPPLTTGGGTEPTGSPRRRRGGRHRSRGHEHQNLAPGRVAPLERRARAAPKRGGALPPIRGPVGARRFAVDNQGARKCVVQGDSE